MQCWKCGVKLENFPWGKVPFRASCETCGSDVHCCRNCVYYKPGLPNDCAVPGTEFVSDREKNNHCEEFKALGQGPQAKEDHKKRFDALFNE